MTDTNHTIQESEECLVENSLDQEVKTTQPASKKRLWIAGSIVMIMMALAGGGLGVYYGWYLPQHSVTPVKATTYTVMNVTVTNTTNTTEPISLAA